MQLDPKARRKLAIELATLLDSNPLLEQDIRKLRTQPNSSEINPPEVDKVTSLTNLLQSINRATDVS